MPLSFPEPLSLDFVGSRFVGGRRVTRTGGEVRSVALSPGLTGYRSDPNDTFAVEQAYVASFVPSHRTQDTPVLLVAGGGLTGACWESTPDGRPGWLVDLLRAGIPVDVLDNVERGRAGWSALPGIWDETPVTRGERDMWTSFRIGPADGYPDHPFEGTQFPVSALPELLKQAVPRWPGNDALALRTLLSVLAELGPRVLVGHSHGGGLCARAMAEGAPVSAAVLVEPHGLPLVDDVPVGRPPVALVTGDFLDDSELWRDLTPLMQAYADGVGATGIHLPDHGHRGNSHNPMMDRNSSAVAALLLDWLAGLRAAGAVS